MAEEANNGNAEEKVEEAKEEVETAAEAVEEAAEAKAEEAQEKAGKVKSSASKTINDAFKQVETFTESISKALGSALQDRANVVMVRVNDDSLAYLDMLVDADITKSRSESAAFLINEGIKANQGLFDKIREITDQIAALRAQLRETVHVEE
jgi:uncharacterized FlaG/YvyC family protein